MNAATRTAAFFLLLAGSPVAHGSGQTPAATPTPASTLKAPQAPTRSFVYTEHDPSSIQHYETNSPRVRAMVDRLVAAATGKESAAAGWRSLVEPKDVVGIKISAAGGASGATHHAVVAAIVDGLEAAGVPKANIVVWDRDAEDLHAAGYLARDERTPTFDCNVLAIEPKFGYDAKYIYRSPVLGKLIWGDLLFSGNPVPADLGLHDPIDPQGRNMLEAVRPTPTTASTAVNNPGNPKKNIRDVNLSSESHYCTILTKRVTKVVNVPVYADNIYTGLGGALYNVTIPNIDNWRRLVDPAALRRRRDPGDVQRPATWAGRSSSTSPTASSRRSPVRRLSAALRPPSRHALRQPRRRGARRRAAAPARNLAQGVATPRPRRNRRARGGRRRRGTGQLRAGQDRGSRR